MAVTITELARERHPRRPIVTGTDGPTYLRAETALAWYHRAEDARRAMVRVEGGANRGADVAFVGFGATAPAGTEPSQHDRARHDGPEREEPTAAVARPFVGGLVAGHLVGFVVLTLVLYLFTRSWPISIGGAIGGSLIIGMLTSYQVVFRRVAGTDAWRDSFSDAEDAELALLAVVAVPRDQLAPTMAQLRDTGAFDVELVDQDGQSIRRPPIDV